MFMGDAGLGPNDEIDYRYEMWESLTWHEQGGMVTASHGATTLIYTVADNWNGYEIITRRNGESVDFVCDVP